jgi:hypothetical protein
LAQRKPEKIYEIFVLSCFVQAGRTAGLQVTIQDDSGTHSTITVRGGPGSIYNSPGPNTYVLIGGPHRRWEIQHGIYVRGFSDELHEADIAAIDHETGQSCRQRDVHPVWRKSPVIAECKFYAPNSRNTNLPHGLGCHLLGRANEFPDSMILLCANQAKPSIARMLNAHQRRRFQRNRAFFELVPTKPTRVSDFRHWLATELRHAL